VSVWVVLVTAGEGALEGWDALDPLLEAVEAQPATLGVSVAGGAEPSVFVSVEAEDVPAAREAAESIVGAALERVGRVVSAVAVSVFAEDGRVVFERSEGS
jgi:hypothetical protein